MTDSNFERLSAAYDGEATSSERAEVDRWLAESSAASEVWDDFGQISQRLRDLPAASLPADFTDSVLARISSVPSPNPVPPERFARRWLFPLIAFASAAVVLVLIRIAGMDQPEAKVATKGEFARTVASATPAVKSERPAPKNEEFTDAVAHDAEAFPVAMNGPAPTGKIARASAGKPGRASAGAAIRPSSPEMRVASAPPIPAPPSPSEAPLPVAAPPAPSRQGDAPKRMESGEVLEERFEQGGVVKVVRVFVIDQRQLEKFQEVLSRNEILPDPQLDVPQPAMPPIEQPVLLVVATEKQFSTALEQSVDLKVVQSYVEGTPLEIGQLPQDWQVALRAETAPRRRTAPAAPAGTAPSRAVAKGAEKKSSKRAGSDMTSETRRSTQTSVALTAPMKPLLDEASEKPQAGSAQAARPASEPGAVAGNNAKEMAKAKTKATDPAPAASLPPAGAAPSDRWVILVQVAPAKNLKARDSTPRKAGDG